MVLSYLSSYVYGAPSASSSATSVRRTARKGKGPAGSGWSSSARRSQHDCYTNDDDDARDAGSSSDAHPATDPALDLLDYINTTPSLYDVVGVSTSFTSTDELRRAYMGRCRVCHPDKFPNYTEEATSAFQRVSLAYETLSKPSSRRAYDLSGFKNGGFAGRDSDPMSGSDLGDETLRSVLYTMYCDFMEKGDFEMVRVLVEALNASNPGLNLGEEAIDGIEGALKRLRHIILSGAKHFKVVKFELIRLYEIQHDLRQLSYFDVFGRLRLSLQLARVTLSIPMAIDKSMREDGEEDDEGYDGDIPTGYVEEGDGNANCAQVAKRGLLGPRIASVLGLAVAVLEKGERII